MKKCLLLGNGGREAVLAEKMILDYSIYSILPYENPSIIDAIQKSNGKYIIGNPFDKQIVKKFILENKIKYCLISSDNLLKEGLIDLAKELGLETFGPSSKGSKLEWSKTYGLEVVEQIAPEMIIKNYNITNENKLKEIISKYNKDEFVIKPEGLTGGKGVKVGGIHFKGKKEGLKYALSCLKAGGKVIIQDKVEGEEFTVMCFTDGKNIVTTPITFDYPYRLDGDKGPGTGGMGCLSFENKLLPFLNQKDVDKCSNLIQKAIQYVNKESFEFNGILYGGFFKCKNGIKFIEFNARFGDPEALNVLNALETPFYEVMQNIFNKKLSKKNCIFKSNCTFTVYIVTKEYAIKKTNEKTIFKLNIEKIIKNGAKIYFANAKKIEDDTYTSISNSRLFGITTIASTLEDAKQKAYDAIRENIDKKLDYRKDIGSIYKH